MCQGAQLCMEDLICHQQKQRFAHPPITATSRSEWPHLSLKNKATLADGQILLGPTQSKAGPVKYKTIVFGDPKTMRCELYLLFLPNMKKNYTRQY